MKIVKDGANYLIFNDVEISDKFEPVNYVLVWDVKGNCALQRADSFTIPEKIYDVSAAFRNQVRKSFGSIHRNLGVCLDGYKGMGKTMDAKLLCREAGLPVVMINRPVPQSVDFVGFLNSIKQPIVLFIDEFEKNFDVFTNDNGDPGGNYHGQDSFLSMMDGAISSEHKRLFLFTTNSTIGDKFINRPGRIRYYKKYDFMSEDMYNQIIADKLKNKELEKDLRDNISLPDCTVDLLTTIIEEINLHNVPYSSFKTFFNHQPKKVSYQRFEYIPSTKRYEYKDHLELDRAIDKDTKYLEGQTINIIGVSGDEITYKTKDVQVENNKKELIDVIHRVKKVPNYTLLS